LVFRDLADDFAGEPGTVSRGAARIAVIGQLRRFPLELTLAVVGLMALTILAGGGYSLIQPLSAGSRPRHHLSSRQPRLSPDYRGTGPASAARYGMNAAFMQFRRHERGIHAV
jgi:hypothetical protein